MVSVHASLCWVQLVSLPVSFAACTCLDAVVCVVGDCRDGVHLCCVYEAASHLDALLGRGCRPTWRSSRPRHSTLHRCVQSRSDIPSAWLPTSIAYHVCAFSLLSPVRIRK
ncbi:hypothetical protein PF005_g31466 [Phytophthora fragariae]|uniref:Secreted protein n=1 Tax=Phytophthora fragariae TaxID=53985 RepID=A0A6A3DGW3_9STRA|nr:hypothetical protein PF009_g31542 [Phytophthora fragariae]KAE9160879.1 hypothetical protein PF005_g31466 [Phytophthora fragariae]KAE9264508.1 hypothetical protein PF001_g31250 [Phytophthora fragariae]KAE9266904.1 hypothetical protein PF008_g31495 [Phytophthora fragariae]